MSLENKTSATKVGTLNKSVVKLCSMTMLSNFNLNQLQFVILFNNDIFVFNLIKVFHIYFSVN